MQLTSQKFKEVLVSWAFVYPLITVLLWGLNPMMESWLLPAKTLLVTLIVVPTMSLVVMPFIEKSKRILLVTKTKQNNDSKRKRS